jgi:hypothetical protein
VTIDNIGAAPLDQVAGLLQAVQLAADDAAGRLKTAVPPPQYVASNKDLAVAFSDLARQLSSLQNDVRLKRFCTVPPVLATLSNLPGADAIRRAAQGLGSGGAELTGALPPATPVPDRHEKNGAVLHAPKSGLGSLEVQNDSDSDVVMTLSKDGSVVGSVYVTQGQKGRHDRLHDNTGQKRHLLHHVHDYARVPCWEHP